MKKNEEGFPNYLELFSKLDLGNNDVLKEYIDYIYDTYNQLYRATSNISPEENKFIKELRYLRSRLMTIHEDKLKNCKSITEINNDILATLMHETATRNIFNIYISKCIYYFNRNIDHFISKYETKWRNKDKTATRNIFKAYIRKCIDYLNRNINPFFGKYETKCRNKDKTIDEEIINNEKLWIEASYNEISKYSKEIQQYKQKLSEAEKNLEIEKANLYEYLKNISNLSQKK